MAKRRNDPSQVKTLVDVGIPDQLDLVSTVAGAPRDFVKRVLIASAAVNLGPLETRVPVVEAATGIPAALVLQILSAYQLIAQ